MSILRGTITPAFNFTNQPTGGVTAGQVTEVVLAGAPYSVPFSFGTGAGQADVIWSQGVFGNVGTVWNITGTTTIDLTSLVSSTGAAIGFARVKGVYIQNNTAGTTLTVGGGSNPFNTLWGSTLILNGGEVYCSATNDAGGHVVTPSTGCIVQFVASAALSATIVVVGASA